MSPNKNNDSYSYSYSYEYEDEESDSDQPLLSSTPVKKNARARNARGKNVADSNRKKVAFSESSSPAVGKAPIERPPTTSTRTKKEEAVAQLLCRWWYVLPPWPREDWNYSEELVKNRLNLVPIELWADSGEFAENGFRNCYALEHVTGFYRLANGDLMDLRPIDGMPSYFGLSQYSYKEICSMLVIALENQIEDISGNYYKNTDGAYIKEQEDRLRRLLNEYKSKL